jgi:hypothetical protein
MADSLIYDIGGEAGTFSDSGSWSGTGSSGGGGGGGGFDASSLMDLGSSLGGLFGASQDRDAAADASREMAAAYAKIGDDAREDAGVAQGMSDPFSQYREGHAQNLNSILSGETDFTTDPGYQFRMNEAMRETERAGAARGYNNSSNVMHAVNARAQDVASGEYDKIINRLTGLAGATPQNAMAGGQTYGNMMGDVYSAQASGAANRASANNPGGNAGMMGGIGGLIGTGMSMFGGGGGMFG